MLHTNKSPFDKFIITLPSFAFGNFKKNWTYFGKNYSLPERKQSCFIYLFSKPMSNRRSASSKTNTSFKIETYAI